MHIRGDHAELVVGGRLDVRTAADARKVLHSAVDGGHGDLVLDLTELDSWDATGLGVIMGAHRRCGRADRRLVLRGVPAQMQRLLVATRLHRILVIEGESRQKHCRGPRAPTGRAATEAATPDRFGRNGGMAALGFAHTVGRFKVRFRRASTPYAEEGSRTGPTAEPRARWGPAATHMGGGD